MRVIHLDRLSRPVAVGIGLLCIACAALACVIAALGVSEAVRLSHAQHPPHDGWFRFWEIISAAALFGIASLLFGIRFLLRGGRVI